MSAEADIPDGFEPHGRRSPFTDPLEPLYARIDTDQYSIGLIAREAHCNSRRLVHGGCIATLVDNAMGLTCLVGLKAEGRTVQSMVTVNLSIDYVGQARLGDWLETDSSVVKLGGSLAFVQTVVRSAGTVVARANATFKMKTA